ncbi:hemerythrin domain-containing protein [Leptolyngbya sp. FACHB-261]|uniref:hemerythrin domain-containing protein n=1 Tax=Leptolyngbya sp. FACHB-261 TaxID=2692806 RepID=UPI00168250AA|nr:hemerythrin domain-containing protein [Leptolyngbya sp. FACHB-261]MBD2102919.1 hemerythrin domain-containing protein [Leptolyngbya sp. FACHB-261]
MNVLELLKRDHKQVDALFTRLENASGTQEIGELFEEIYNALSEHSLVEKEIFYPAVQDFQDTEGLIDEAYGEHASVEELLEEIYDLSPSASDFKARVSQLRQAVQHHVAEEENELFPKVRHHLDKEELEAMGNQIQQMKTEVQNELAAG